MQDPGRTARFEATVLVHLGAAYNVARWITRDAAGAEDAVQEACVRALRFFDAIQGPSPRAWFMAIVRNACRDWLRERGVLDRDEPFDEAVHHLSVHRADATALSEPEAAAFHAAQTRWVREGIEALPADYREILVLRELEDLSYKEIGAIVQVPIGTVMSRLSRARDLLQQRLSASRRRSSR